MLDLAAEMSYIIVDETIVSIKHPLRDFARPVNLQTPEVRIKTFPQENLVLNLVISGASCGYCLNKIANQPVYFNASTCSCDQRNYNLQLSFQNALHLMSTDYYYDITCRLSKKSSTETLFSFKCHRKDVQEILKGELREPTVNLRDKENHEEVQVHLKICRFKKGRELKRNCDLADFYEKTLDFNQQVENVVLNVAGRIFNVNKQILVNRSPVFKAMFSHEMSETKSNIVDFKDMEADAIEIMLQYLHTNKTDNIHKKPIEIYEAAHYFGIEDLEDVCVEWMKFNIDPENFVSILRLAMRHSELTDLNKSIGKYVEHNKESIVKRDDYQRVLLDTLHNDTVTEILLLCNDYPVELKDLRMQAMKFLRDNIKEVVRKDEFMGLFKDDLTHDIIQFLFAANQGGNGKRKRSK